MTIFFKRILIFFVLFILLIYWLSREIHYEFSEEVLLTSGEVVKINRSGKLNWNALRFINSGSLLHYFVDNYLIEFPEINGIETPTQWGESVFDMRKATPIFLDIQNNKWTIVLNVKTTERYIQFDFFDGKWSKREPFDEQLIENRQPSNLLQYHGYRQGSFGANRLVEYFGKTNKRLQDKEHLKLKLRYPGDNGRLLRMCITDLAFPKCTSDFSNIKRLSWKEEVLLEGGFKVWIERKLWYQINSEKQSHKLLKNQLRLIYSDVFKSFQPVYNFYGPGIYLDRFPWNKFPYYIWYSEVDFIPLHLDIGAANNNLQGSISIYTFSYKTRGYKNSNILSWKKDSQYDLVTKIQEVQPNLIRPLHKNNFSIFDNLNGKIIKLEEKRSFDYSNSAKYLQCINIDSKEIAHECDK
jgi:hypothetical protein